MRGMLYWEEKRWPACTYVEKYELGHYKPKSERTENWTNPITGRQVQEDPFTTNTNRFMASKSPLKIKNVLLHPWVKEPTCACKAYNTWKPENALNWWGIHGEENPLTYGMGNVNTVSKNKYSSRLPGYLSIK
jgi:hypothetical protein